MSKRFDRSKTLCALRENSFLYFFGGGGGRIRFASSTSTLFSYTRPTSPSLFIPRNALSANPPGRRLFSFALVPVVAAPDATAASQEDKSLPGVNRVCPPRLRRRSAPKGGRLPSSFELLPAAFCF